MFNAIEIENIFIYDNSIGSKVNNEVKQSKGSEVICIFDQWRGWGNLFSVLDRLFKKPRVFLVKMAQCKPIILIVIYPYADW